MPCGEPWITAEAAPCDESSFGGTTLADACQLATRLLFIATGRRWPGECATRQYVCDLEPVDRLPGVDLTWLLGSCGHCSSTVVRLRGSSIAGVDEVAVAGVPLDGSAWQLRHRRYLVRLDGGRWPCCRRVDDQGDTTVTYRWGAEPPAGASIVAGVLACELAKAWAKAGDCRLPKNVQALVSEGVSLTMLDPSALLAQTPAGEFPRWGLYEVETWVKAENPDGLRRRGRVIDPARVGRRLVR